MTKILLLSDTHSYIDDGILRHAAEVDQVWHAGDIGSSHVIKELQTVCPLVKAVYGNIDGSEVRQNYPSEIRETVDGMDVFMTHIGGYPGNYAAPIKEMLYHDPPALLICGHSHILKVMSDRKLNLLHMNPGAAGKYGFHSVRTMLKFSIDQGIPQDLFVVELGKTKSG